MQATIIRVLVAIVVFILAVKYVTPLLLTVVPPVGLILVIILYIAILAYALGKL